MNEFIEFSDEQDQIIPAFVAALAEITNVSRDNEGQAGNRAYRYTTLGAVNNEVRSVLARHDLAVMQSVKNSSDTVEVATRLIHASGQWAQTRFALGFEAALWRNPQEVGKVVTYARRYGLTAMFNIAPADDEDDGASAANAARAAAQAADVAPTPFDDPNRDPLLATRQQHDAIRGRLTDLTDEGRVEIREWCEENGIRILVSSLTAAQAGEVLDKIAMISLRAESDRVKNNDATDGDEDHTGPASLMTELVDAGGDFDDLPEPPAPPAE